MDICIIYNLMLFIGLFVNEKVQNVTFSTGDSSFDTRLRIIDQYYNDITNLSTNTCDGDDCVDQNFNYCPEEYLSETFTMYDLDIGPYIMYVDGLYASSSDPGDFIIRTYCPEQQHISRGLWGYPTFSIFVNDIMEPEKAFDTMDIDGDGELSYDEVVLHNALYSEISYYNTSDTDAIISDIFNYTEDGLEYYEYLAQIFFQQMDNDSSNTTSKSEYVSYIIDKEWDNHDLDQDIFINFNEFKQEFFESSFYSGFKKIAIAMISKADELNGISYFLDDAAINHLDSLSITMAPHSFDSQIQRYINISTAVNNPTEFILFPAPSNLVDIVNIMKPTSNRRRLFQIGEQCAGITTNSECTNSENTD